MSSVTVDLGAATGTQPPVEWPDRCTCCGKPSPGSHGALTHTILSVSNTAPGTVLAEPIHMHWRVPTCPACLEHQRVAASRSPIPPQALAGVVVLDRLATGWQLFTMGLSDDIVAIAGYATAMAATGRWRLRPVPVAGEGRRAPGREGHEPGVHRARRGRPRPCAPAAARAFVFFPRLWAGFCVARMR